MSYRIDELDNSLVIDGWENGIAASPYQGIANIRNINTSYYPGVAYVNYRRQAVTLSDGAFFAGTHSTDVSGNTGWIFTAPSTTVMGNPIQGATSPDGLIYILDSNGEVWKQSAVNSSTFITIGGGAGRFTTGAQGLAYWNNYIVVFGDGVIEFCGDGTGDAGIVSTNWNVQNAGIAHNTTEFTTNFAVDNYLTTTSNLNGLIRFQEGDPVQFTTTNTLPAGLALLTTYYILDLDRDNNKFKVEATIGGGEVTLTSDGAGTHTVTDYANPLPLGNCTAFNASGFTEGSTTLTINSYTDPLGNNVDDIWAGATGLYNIVMPDGQKLPGRFTNGSASITLLSPLVYASFGSGWTVELIDPDVTFYRPYVSKVDGELYFCNGSLLGVIALEDSPNLSLNPAVPLTYTVSVGNIALPQNKYDTIVDMVDLKNSLVVAGQNDIYTWDYTSATLSSPAPVDETIVSITNVLNKIYILAGQKGNLYLSNGYSASLYYKISDFIAGTIDPVWSWGGIMSKRAKLFFQATVKTLSGTNILAGVFSIDTVSNTVVQEAQNSYGLTPAAGALATGVLIDNTPSSNGQDSFYSAWSNGAALGGIDYNDTSLWQNWEPVIETDIIPLGSILNKQTLSLIEFKLDRPMVTGDQIRLSWRPSLSDSYTLMGTTTSAQLSDYYPSNIFQSQWAQFKVEMSCAASGSSRIPLREIRIKLK